MTRMHRSHGFSRISLETILFKQIAYGKTSEFTRHFPHPWLRCCCEVQIALSFPFLIECRRSILTIDILEKSELSGLIVLRAISPRSFCNVTPAFVQGKSA